MKQTSLPPQLFAGHKIVERDCGTPMKDSRCYLAIEETQRGIRTMATTGQTLLVTRYNPTDPQETTGCTAGEAKSLTKDQSRAVYNGSKKRGHTLAMTSETITDTFGTVEQSQNLTSLGVYPPVDDVMKESFLLDPGRQPVVAIVNASLLINLLSAMKEILNGEMETPVRLTMYGPEKAIKVEAFTDAPKPCTGQIEATGLIMPMSASIMAKLLAK